MLAAGNRVQYNVNGDIYDREDPTTAAHILFIRKFSSSRDTSLGYGVVCAPITNYNNLEVLSIIRFRN